MKTNMKKFLVYLPFLCLLSVAVSCKKDEATKPEEPKPETTLAFVGKSFQMTSFVLTPAIDIDGDGKVDSDLMKYLPACNLDDIIIFEKDGRMSGNGGTNHCPDENPPSNVAKWSYNTTTKMLKMEDGTDITEWKVLEMSSKKLAVETTESNNGVEFKAVLTMTAK
jgi:hypothetical protein